MPQLWTCGDARRSTFGDAVLVAFLMAQALDGVFTYVGVVTFGPSVEGNPLMASLMASVGHGPALAAAKLVAGTLGVALHLSHVHRLVALLTGLYLAAAIIPWTALLFL